MEQGAAAAILERPAGAAELAGLQAAITADPADADALFKLAVLLHRAGRRRAAREMLTKLAGVYEQGGQRSLAERRRRSTSGSPRRSPTPPSAAVSSARR